jgi:hypothetical protein
MAALWRSLWHRQRLVWPVVAGDDSISGIDPQLPVANGRYRDLPVERSNTGFGVVRRPTTYLLLRVFGASIIPFDSE